MTWFKVDDTFAFHPKTMAAGNAAVGLWVRAGSWSAQQLSDGVIPTHAARNLGTPGQADQLVDAGLWLPSGHGFVFHQWEERNPTRKQVESKRQADAERIRKWRQSRGE